MRVTVFSTQNHDRRFLDPAFRDAGHDPVLLEHRLTPDTAALAAGSDAVCVFVNDDAGTDTLGQLAASGVGLVLLRCAGFNNVDLDAANAHGIAVARVPAYSPEAVAEHTLALILALNRRIHRAWLRVREGNFALHGLLGFNLHGKTVGVVGTGRIGSAVTRILNGFGCRVLAHDPEPAAVDAEYVELDELFQRSAMVTLHCPLTPDTHHLIDDHAIARMPEGVMLVNTSRGATVDTRAVIAGLKSGRVGALGLDVYEQEGDLFFRDLSDEVIRDDTFQRLLTFPNVLVTGHQGFFTREALESIAAITRHNLDQFAAGEALDNRVTAEQFA